MKGIASHFAILSETEIARQTVLLFNSNNTLINKYALSDLSVETSGTMFVDGLVSLPIVSVSKYLNKNELLALQNNFQVLRPENEFGYMPNDLRPVLIDFATEDYFECYRSIKQNFEKIAMIDLFDFVKAATTRPAQIVGLQSTIDIGSNYRLTAWENVDFKHRRLKHDTRPVKLNLFENY